MIVEFGAMSSKYRIEAEDIYQAIYCILMYYGTSNHLVVIYEPKDAPRWFNPSGKVSEKLDEIYKEFGGLDKYLRDIEKDEEKVTKIRQIYKSIKQIV